MQTAIIEKVEYVKEWGKGLNKVHYHNVTFEGETKHWNIGTKEQDPDFLKPGKSLNYEITDEEKRKIKRANTGQMGNKSFVPRAGSSFSFKKKKEEVLPETPALIRKLGSYNESDIVFFDIETASVVKKLKKGTDLHDAWLYKTRYNNELNRKTGKEFTPEEYYDEKAALYSPFAKVVAIVAGKIVDDKLKVKKYFGDEAEMLTGFNDDIEKLIEKNSNTILAGWANLGFDQPFLAQRMIINGTKPNILLDNAHLKPWECRAIDLKELWKGTAFYPESLPAVAVALGLPSPKNGLIGSEVSEAFHAGKINDIVEYCTGDVLTTANIYRKFMGKELVTLK